MEKTSLNRLLKSASIPCSSRFPNQPLFGPEMIQDDERSDLCRRFVQEGLDPDLPDDKKLPYVWRWLADAESNCVSLRKQIEKLYKQQEMDIREVEQYVEHVWQISSEKIKSLQGENQVLKAKIEVHKKSCNLEPINNFRENHLLDPQKARPGIKSLFRMGKNGSQQPRQVSSSLKVPSNMTHASLLGEASNHYPAAGNQCLNCIQVINQSRGLIQEFEATVRQLRKENDNLTQKLSEVTKLFHRLRKERGYLAAGISSSAIQMRPGSDEKETREEDIRNAVNPIDIDETSKSESTQESNMSSDVGVSVSDSGNGSNTCASEPSRCRAPASEVTDGKGDSIQDLRSQVKRLRRELQIKETEYEDLLRKYEMMKEKYKDNLSNMRERIEHENAKWQQLFQAANGRRRQAMQELDKYSKGRIISS